jgi:transcriptional regulator with XRE-family HTH domain
MNIAIVLRSWRHHEEMTLQQAAEKVGLSLDTYRRLEMGGKMEGDTLAKVLRWLLA